MDPEKVNKIKDAVRRNFDSSPVQYDEFEARYGFFKSLNATLLKSINSERAESILDIGCGTGASCLQLAQACPQAGIVGLDNSPAMLQKARDNCCTHDRILFVEGDASALTSCLDRDFDAIIYSASIFLIPDFKESIRQAYGLLKPSGQVGMTFMDGVYSDAGEHLFSLVEEKLGLGVSLRKAVSLSDLEVFVRSVFDFVSIHECNFRLPRNQVREFFSIPAMSAGLFPSLDYQNRLARLATLFDNIHLDELNFRWVIIVGTKS